MSTLATLFLFAFTSGASALEPFLYIRGTRVYVRRDAKDVPVTPVQPSGSIIRLFGVSPTGWSFALNFDRSGEVEFYDALGKKLGQLSGHRGWPGMVQWSPDGTKAALVNYSSFGTQDIPSSAGTHTHDVEWLDLKTGRKGSYHVVMGYRLLSKSPLKYDYTSNKPYGGFLAWGPDSSTLWFHHPNNPSIALPVRVGEDAPGPPITLPRTMRWDGVEQDCRSLMDADGSLALWRGEGIPPLAVPIMTETPYRHLACSRPLRAFVVVHASTQGIVDDRWNLSLFEVAGTDTRMALSVALGVPRGLRWAGRDLLLDDGHGIERLLPNGRRETLVRKGRLQELPLRNPYPKTSGALRAIGTPQALEAVRDISAPPETPPRVPRRQ